MKTNKQRKFIKLGIFLFGISFFILACQKDDDLKSFDKDQSINQTEFKISKVGKPELQNNKLLKRKLSKLSESLLKRKTNIQNKTIASSEYGFTINTDYATYIENADRTYHSYTFYIERSKKTNSLENLLLSLQPDGTYKMKLITYETTKQEKEDIINGLSVNLKGKVSSITINDEGLIVNIFNKAYDCEGYIVYESCGCNVHNSETGYESCDTACYNYDREYFGCGSTGGGSTGGGSTGGGSTGGGSTGGGSTGGGQTNNGGSGNTSSNDDVSTPTGPCVGHDCPDEFEEDDCTSDASPEIITQLDGLVGTGDSYEFDCNLVLSNSISFNSIQELQAFLEDTSFEDINVVTPQQDGTHTTDFKVVLGLVHIDINITQQLEDLLNDQTYGITNLSSSLNGFTLGVSWNQTTPNESTDYTIFNNTVIIDLIGQINYNIFIEGIGTVYSQQKHYQMIVDKETGQQISIIEIDN